MISFQLNLLLNYPVSGGFDRIGSRFTDTGPLKHAVLQQSLKVETHLDDLDGLFDLLQFLGSLLDQMFDLRLLPGQITLREEKPFN